MSLSTGVTRPAPAAPQAPGRVADVVKRWALALRAYPLTALVFALGLALRAVLVPITHGKDFVVWDLASRATLAGINVYAHHPHYPGGPYTYFPLFLYVELPFQWLAEHTGVSFTVFGKLPIVAGDVLAGAMIAAYLGRRGFGDRVVALGTALYLLNPLVLYNGAFYGRFDAFCVGLFLFALHFYTPGGQRHTEPAGQRHTEPGGQRHTEPAGQRRAPTKARPWRFPLLYAIAVAAKTYPIFILPWFLLRETRRCLRMLAALVIVLGGLALPYLITSPKRFFADVVLYNGSKLPGNLSWQVVLLHVMSPNEARLLSYVFLLLFAGALFLVTRLDLYTYCAVAILLFLVFSKVVIEQYFLWPMPFLIVAALERRSWASWGLLILTSATGTLINPYIYPFGQRVEAANVLVAVCIAAYVLTRRPLPPAASSPARAVT